MADYVVTAANVVPSASAIVDRTHVAGEALTRGAAAYYDSATGKWKLMDANAAATGNGLTDTKGIVLNDAALDQPVAVCLRDSDFTHGLTGVVAGDSIISSGTAGKLAPVADLVAGWYATVFGVAKSATKMNLAPVSCGAAKA